VGLRDWDYWTMFGSAVAQENGVVTTVRSLMANAFKGLPSLTGSAPGSGQHKFLSEVSETGYMC